MKRHLTHWLAAVLGSLALVACGGGSDSPPPQQQATASVTGHVVDMDSDQAVANATVRAGSASTTTAADGSFTLKGVAAADRTTVQVEAAGHGPNVAVVKLAAGGTTDVRVRLLKLAAPQTFDAASAATVGNAAGTAQVVLPAGSLVNAATGAAATGTVSVSVTSVDPARDPERMPGGFTTADNGTVRAIESFGAVKVDLRDAAGERLNLAPGQTAKIRIPLSTRSPNPPASLPLWHFDEASARWVEEGSATLGGSGANQYYEGTVSHFSYWNADQIADTVELEGCVVTADGKPAANVLVSTSGVDYSGSSNAVTDANGHFVVQVRKDSTVGVWAATATLVTPIHQVTLKDGVGATMPECMVLEPATSGSGKLAPKVLGNPRSQSVAVGESAYFFASIEGTQPMLLQWLRNGQPIAGETGPMLWLVNVAVADDGSVYSLRATNAAGTVTSLTATLSVSATPRPPAIVLAPRDLAVNSGETAAFSVSVTGSAPMSYQWQRNGQAIAGATAAVYSFLATDADNGATFSVQVRNGGGQVQSTAATLTVVPQQSAPVITTQPQSIVVLQGQRAAFGVVAVGSGPLSYQWQRNGTDLAGETGEGLTLDNVTAADSGAQFRVVVKNAKGSVTSSAATLTVNAVTPDDQAKLLALMMTWMPGLQAAGAPLEFADDDFKLKAVGALCAGGTASLKLDGGAAPAPGSTLPTGTHTLAAQFSGCQTESQSTYDGDSSLAYTFASQAQRSGTGQSTVGDFRMTTTDINGVEKTWRVKGSAKVELDGSVAGTTETSVLRYLPASGLTITDTATQAVATLTGGNVLFKTVSNGTLPSVSRQEYAQFGFTRGGVGYALDGFFELDFNGQGLPTSGSGTVTITGNGKVIGRVKGTAGGLVIEVVDASLLGALPTARAQAAALIAPRKF